MIAYIVPVCHKHFRGTGLSVFQLLGLNVCQKYCAINLDLNTSREQLFTVSLFREFQMMDAVKWKALKRTKVIWYSKKPKCPRENYDEMNGSGQVEKWAWPVEIISSRVQV